MTFLLSNRIYQRNRCITFKSTKGKFGALSNMAPGFPLHIRGVSIRTSEALYQALRFPEYPNLQEEIIKFSSPISAKNFGRLHIHNTMKDWDIHRFKIMRFCIELKLFQNMESFTKVLLATGSLPIVEYTETDKIWGATQEGDWYTGTNALGRLLMQLREQIRAQNFDIKVPEITDLKFFGKSIVLADL